jgi:DNA modification methylase
LTSVKALHAVRPKLSYEKFIRAKMAVVESHGIEVKASEIHPWLKPHARDIVCWGLKLGSAAIFAAFGLHKTSIQLEIARLIVKKTGGRFLIVAPLGVRQEFKRDAEKLGIIIRFVRRIEECAGRGVFITNYETVRDGKLDPSRFTGASLDEAAVLADRGNKTFGEFAFKLFNTVKYKFVATATPSPNEYQELLSYAAFLGVADISQARTRFFKRNPQKMDELTLHPHKVREFHLWLSGWAIFLQSPSDMGYSDEGYKLPPLEIHWHEIPAGFTAEDANNAKGTGLSWAEAAVAKKLIDPFIDREINGSETGTPKGFLKSGPRQRELIKRPAIGMIDAAREKRDSLNARLAKLMELRAIAPDEHRIIWHDLEAERKAIEKAIPSATTVYGKQDLEEREKAIINFSDGSISELATKPVIAGSGCNFQRHCSWAIFMGVGFKFREFIQAIHRIYRFLQTRPVRIDIIYTEREREVKRVLEEKWEQHKKLTAQMSEIIREYGLARNALEQELRRTLGVERKEESGPGWTSACNDSVYEMPRLKSDCAGLILTSLPFGNQYEYTPSYHDLGHTDTNEHFFEQMDYLTPELYRILKPGRAAAVHVKDRIVPSGMSGLGFQTVYDFHSDVKRHFCQHGFAFLGMNTIVTDVVRENDQTYRLGWTEQCKDGSRMGYGLPEYLLLFRKPPTDRSNGYADEPVMKHKPDCFSDAGEVVEYSDQDKYRAILGTGYSRARWQLDAHGFARSNGNRLLAPEDMTGLDWPTIFKLYRQHSISTIYDYQHHVELGETLDRAGQLPRDFMLLPPQSWHPDVWTDVMRARTLNAAQTQKGREKHICPLQFDIVDRVIERFSMPGELVVDPFAGIGTVLLRGLKLGREVYGSELSERYWWDGVQYCKGVEKDVKTPTLFDALEDLTTDTTDTTDRTDLHESEEARV